MEVNFRSLHPFSYDISFYYSPPWGGPEYISKEIFSIADLGLFGKQAYDVGRQISPNVAFFLPRNASVEEVS